MLTIDGSVMEGGGQVVRTAVALSAITRTAVTVHNIRAGREKTGLKAQHIAAIRAVAATCRARCEGLFIGSDRILFIPGELVREDIVIEIGTAGSIPLVIEAWLPAALHTGGSVTITGGTEIENSPTIDYVQHLYMNFLRHHGAPIVMTIIHRGYYPEGGGEVRVEVENPVEIGSFCTPVSHIPLPEIFSCSSNLPPHVVERQAASAKKHLSGIAGSPDIHADIRTGRATGCSVTVVNGWKGSSAIGRIGLPAEKVGEIAAGRLVEEIKKPGTLDLHLADQLLIYLAQYGGAYSATGCTLHSRTVCFILEKFGYTVKVSKNKGVVFYA